MSRMRFLWMCVAAAAYPAEARSDGGALRYSGEKEGYRIAVFTAPVPPRVGAVDVSVLVQEVATGHASPDVPVFVSVHPAGAPHLRQRRAATEAAATNKLFRAATFELTRAGRWLVEVELADPFRAGPVRFDIDAAAPLPGWVQIAPWVGWPFAALALAGFHQWLVRRRRVRRPARGGNAPGS